MSTSLESGGATPRPPRDGTTDVWTEVQQSPDFQQLRHRVRGFAFPATAAFLAWYLLYILMSMYARGFMGQKLLGHINVAYVFGLLQFVSTFLIALVYSRRANRTFDPLADKLRAEIERR